MIYGFRFRTRFSKVARRSQDQAGDLATTVEESVHGIRVLKAFGRSREALENFNEQAEELRQTEIAKAKHLATFSLVVTLLPELALGAGLVVGIMLASTGELSIGALVAFFATAAVIAAPVEFCGMLLAMALTAKTAVDRHFEVMDSVNTITSPEQPRRPDDLTGALRFNNATFAYEDAPDKPILKEHQPGHQARRDHGPGGHHRQRQERPAAAGPPPVRRHRRFHHHRRRGPARIQRRGAPHGCRRRLRGHHPVLQLGP